MTLALRIERGWLRFSIEKAPAAYAVGAFGVPGFADDFRQPYSAVFTSSVVMAPSSRPS